MNTSAELGEKILVAVENCSDCVEQLRAIASHIQNASHCMFTLLHCCPPKYWEHGASAESSSEALQVWETAEAEFSESETYLRQARSIFLEYGASQVALKLAVNSSVEGAITSELRQGNYTGLILCSAHSNVIQWVSRRDLFRRFANVPDVAVQTFEPELPHPSYIAATL